MKSNQQKRLEIKAKRIKKAEKLKQLNLFNKKQIVALYAIEADQAELAHNNTYGILPEFYVDKPFDCIDCGSHEIWTAKQQKWWYEVAKGHIDSTAVRCRRCRKVIQAKKAEQKQHMKEMAEKQPYPNEAFFKKLK